MGMVYMVNERVSLELYPHSKGGGIIKLLCRSQGSMYMLVIHILLTSYIYAARIFSRKKFSYLPARVKFQKDSNPSKRNKKDVFEYF